jgi:hypothetical protein
MCNRGKFEFNTIAIAELMKFLRIKIGSIVCDDAVRHTKVASYSLEEFDSGFGCLIRDWYSLDLIGEFIDCYQ